MEKKPRIIEIPIVMDPAAEDAVVRAKGALDQRARVLLETFPSRVAQQTVLHPDVPAEQVAQDVVDADEADLDALKTELVAAQEALAAVSKTFTFRAIGYRAWRALMAAHPSKNKDLRFDVDSIAAPLLRDASADPALSSFEVEELLSSPDWSAGEIDMLINAAITVQS